MRKKNTGYILLILLVVAGFAGTFKTNTLTKQERKFAVNYLKDTRNDLIKSVKGLSEAQLNYKPAEDRWSIKECVQHLALTENALRQMIDGSLKQPANPEKRTDIKVTDDQLIKMVTDRSTKVKTGEPLYPQNSKWKTTDEALEEIKDKRGDLLHYVRTTTEDMRNHVVEGLPFGSADTYQLVLMVAAHTNRHTQQLNEVKTDPGFPKN
jgi:Protein of unknown function (DUF664).